MVEESARNISIHISDRSHVNLTLNVYNCGNRDADLEQIFRKQDYYTLCFVNEGMGYVTEKQATHRVQAGEGFVIFPHVEASYKSEYSKPMNVTWISFSGYLVEQYLSRAKLSFYEPIFRDSEKGELHEMFVNLLHASMKMPNRYCKIMAQLYSVFAFLLDHVPEEVRSANNSPEFVLLCALDFIDTNYNDNNITVEDIAGSAGGNRKSLYAVFKKLTGFSPKDYLIYYRMRKASELLMETDLSVEKVATAVGYGDQFHFSKEFKKNVGFSPSEYRRVVIREPEKKYRSPIDVVRQHFPDA